MTAASSWAKWIKEDREKNPPREQTGKQETDDISNDEESHVFLTASPPPRRRCRASEEECGRDVKETRMSTSWCEPSGLWRIRGSAQCEQTQVEWSRAVVETQLLVSSSSLTLNQDQEQFLKANWSTENIQIWRVLL